VKPSTTTLSEITGRIPGILNAFVGETKLDSTKQMISVFTAPLNAVDCTSSPACAPLKREECSTIDNTCGPCVEGYFGDDHSNVPCFLIDTHFPTQVPISHPSKSPISFPSGQPSCQPSGEPTAQPSYQSTGEPSGVPSGSPSSPSGMPSGQPSVVPTLFPSISRRLAVDEVDYSMNCTSDLQCGKFEYCNLEFKTCNATEKVCLNDCSRQGTCYFEDLSTGLPIDVCLSQDVRCAPVCNCSFGFSGQYCSLNTTLVEEKSSSRLILIDALEGTVLVDNQDRDSTAHLISTVFNLGKTHHELNVTSCSLLLKVIESALKFAKEYQLPYDTVNGVMYSLNQCGYVYAQSSHVGISYENRYVAINEYIGRMMNLYSEVVFQDVVFGEGDVELNYPLFNLVNAVRENTDSTPIVLSPAASLRTRYGTEFSSATISIDKSFAKLQLTLYESAKRLLTHEIISNPLQLSIAFGQTEQIRMSGNEITGTATFTLQNNYPYQYGEEVLQTQEFHTYCNDSVRRVSQYECPNGYIMTHRCDGRRGVLSAVCPKSTWQPVCSLIDGTSVLLDESLTQCKRVSYSATSTVCECLLPNFNIHSKERTLEITTVGKFLPDDEDLVIYFDEDASFEDVVQSNSVMIMSLITTVWGVGVLVMLALCVYNTPEKYYFHIKNNNKVGVEDPTKVMSVVAEAAPVSGREKVKWFFRELKAIFPPEMYYTPVHSLSRMWTVMISQHLYLSVFFGGSDQWIFSRQLAWTLRIATNFTFLMFAVTFIFDLQFPNNKSICTSKDTYELCLSEVNLFDSDQSTCYWYLTEHVNDVDVYSCEYKEIRLTAWGVALMSLLVSCLVCPASFIFDYIFNVYVIAPLIVKPPSEELQDLIVVKPSFRETVLSFLNWNNRNAVDAVSDVDDNGGINLGELSSEDEDDVDVENNIPVMNAMQVVDNAMSELVTNIRVHRQHISTDDSEYFDENWRWNSELGNFTNSEKESVFSCCKKSNIEVSDEPPVTEYDADALPYRTLNYLKTQEEVVDTIDMCEDMKNGMDCAKDDIVGRVMLSVFVMDYLGRENIAAKVFVAHERDLLDPVAPVQRSYKLGAILLLLAANATFLTYVILQNFPRENSYQSSFLIMYWIQFAVEFCWYEAFVCIWMYYSIPFTISREVQAAISALRDSANKVFLHPDEICRDVLNATKFFFVSTRIAEDFPYLLQSQAVLAYRSCYRELNTDRVSKAVKLEKEFFYDITITAQFGELFRLIGVLPIEYQKLTLYFFQLCVAFIIFGIAIEVRQNVTWIYLVAAVAFYEVAMWTSYFYKKNVVHTEKVLLEENDMEEELSSFGHSDDDEQHESNDEIMVDMDIVSGRNGHSRCFNDDEEEKDNDSDLDDLVMLEQNMNQIFNSALLEMMTKADERKDRMVSQDSMYQSTGLQKSSAINLEDSVDEGDFVDEFVQSPHSMFLSPKSASFLREDRNETRPYHNSWAGVRSPVKSSKSNLQSRSLFGANGFGNDGSVVSARSSNFIQPKRNRVQPPQRVAVEGGYNDDSSSDESAVELNEIFDSFFNVDDQRRGGDDDDSVEDYQMMMSTFNFKDHEGDDSDDN